MHTCIHAYIHACIHTYIHSNSRISEECSPMRGNTELLGLQCGSSSTVDSWAGHDPNVVAVKLGRHVRYIQIMHTCRSYRHTDNKHIHTSYTDHTCIQVWQTYRSYIHTDHKHHTYICVHTYMHILRGISWPYSTIVLVTFSHQCSVLYTCMCVYAYSYTLSHMPKTHTSK